MLFGIRRFFQRNRKKFFVTSGVLALIYFGLGYLRQKFIDYQLRLAEEKFSREQIRRRFEQTQKDALYTIYALVPVLCTPIFESLPVENITKSLQARRLEKKGVLGTSDEISSTTTNDQQSNADKPSSDEVERKSKNELWSDLKSQSLTRLITLVYCNALLVLLTRLQLNILSRREYLEDALKVAATKYGFKSKIELVDKTNEQDDYVNEQAFLSFSWWLLNRGWIQIRERVKFAVDEIFQEIDPRTEFTLDEFANLLRKTQSLIEISDSEENNDYEPNVISTALLPPVNLETFVVQQTLDEENLQILRKDPSNLRLLLDETKSYINSSSSSIVLNSLVDVGMSTALHHISLAILQKGNATTANQIKVKLAVLLANVTKASNEFKNSSKNEYITNMDNVPELDEISASIYSNFE